MRTLKTHTTPLCFLPSGKLVCYNAGYIVVFNKNKIEKKVPISIKKIENILGRFRYLYRFFRMGIRAAIAIDENHIAYSIGNVIYELDLETLTISNGFFCGKGIRPLAFTLVNNIEGFDNSIYFGGYLRNLNKKPVRIYKRTAIDKWETVYVFDEGAINHVHSIVSDPYRNCLWLFTGDFDESAAIWKVTNGFKTVIRVACCNQLFRSCVGFAVPDGLLYATDAPFADNFICLLNPTTFQMSKIHPIDGSCIYGCKWKNRFVFSTTVETDGRNESLLQMFFSKTRGAGIKNDFVHLYCGNPESRFAEIYKEKKDSLPYVVFQYGVFRFPSGNNLSNCLYFQPVSTVKNDLDLMVLCDG